MNRGPGLLAGLAFDRLSEQQVVEHIITASRRGAGGWVATPNIDICRLTQRDPALRSLVAGASLIVPDGTPLVWASRLRGDPLPERVGRRLADLLPQRGSRPARPLGLPAGRRTGRAGAGR